MLQIDVRELRDGPVLVSGQVLPDDPLFEGLEVALLGPVTVRGDLQSAGQSGYYWHGKFGGAVKSVCRRCLAEFVSPVDHSVEVLFSSDPELQDDPSVYPLTDQMTHVDVRPAVREELALAVDAYPLCRPDCKGLCPLCGADLNAGPCNCSET